MGKRRRGGLAIADVVERLACAFRQFERLSGMSETHRVDDQFSGGEALEAHIKRADLRLRQQVISDILSARYCPVAYGKVCAEIGQHNGKCPG